MSKYDGVGGMVARV